MKYAALLRRYWREAVVALAVVLPPLALVILGGVWLWQNGRTDLWVAATLGLAILAVPLKRSARRRARERVGATDAPLGKPSPEWNADQRAAWTRVEDLAKTTEPLSFTDRNQAVTVVRTTVDVVARHFHPDTSDPWTRFTVPEALLLTEQLSRTLRREALRRVPGARTLKIGQAVRLYRLYQHRGPVSREAWDVAWLLWRGFRYFRNPALAVAQEASDYLQGDTYDLLLDPLRAEATRLVVLETGRAAIDLYSGRLTLSPEELRAAREADMAAADAEKEEPVRVLLAGQVNAGKSSLVNAMAEEVRCAVGSVPTTAAVKEYRLEVDGRPAVVLMDMPGVDDADGPAFMEQAERADLVLWVASATQPARAPDKRHLDAFRERANADLTRRPPPLLLALTHVDRLRPAAEWAPPYDVAAPVRAKEKTMRDAVRAVAQTLDLSEGAVIPVALPPGGKPYNIEALWARIRLDHLDEAKLAQLDRLRAGRRGLRLGELAVQIGETGRWVAGAVARG